MSSRRLHRCWTWLLACWLLLAATPAFAGENRTEDTERAEAKVIEAKAFFKGGLYKDAASSFLQAFAISKKPATLFNAARAYEEGKQYAQAIALFEQYVRLPETPADGKKDAEDRIAKDRAALEAESAKVPVVVPAPAPSPPAVAPAPPATTPAETKPAEAKGPDAKPTDAAPVETVPAPAARSSNWVDWALFAGGDTLAVVGLLGYLGAVNQVNQANAMDFSTLNAESTYKSQVSSARTNRTISAVIGVVGVGLAGWGAWRIWAPRKDTPTASTTWLVPQVGPEGAGVAWGGRF